MKLKYCLAPTLAFMLALPATAAAQGTTTRPGTQPHGTQQPEGQQQGTQGPAAQHPQTERDDQRRADQRGDQRHNVLRADRIIGQTVRDRQDQRLGRIDDLAFNVEDKKVAYAVVTRGGVWGIGGENVALPWNEVQPDPAARVVRLDEARLQQARRIDMGQGWLTGLGDGPVGTAGTAPEHRVLPMSTIIGMDVHNKRGENLGRIDDVVLNRDGTLNYAVIAHGGFLGVGDSYVAVPWDRLTLDAQRQGAVLDIAADQLERAERFEHRDGNWPERIDWPFGNGQDRR